MKVDMGNVDKQQEDVLVIGAGVIGVCAAYYLLEAGRKVTILDREAICAGSSYGNTGLVVPSHSIPLAAPGVVMQALKWMLDPESPFYIKPRFDPGLFAWLWRFRAACNEQTMRKGIRVLLDMSRASAALYDELVPREGLECSYQRNGLLKLFKTRSGYEGGLEEAGLLREHGFLLRELTAAEVVDMEPNVRSDIAGGVHYQEDGGLNPAEFVLGLAARVQEKGGTIHTGVEVLGFKTSDNGIVSIKTTKGEYRPAQVVLAAGSWSPGLVRDLRLNLPVQPAKGYSVTFKRPDTAPALPVLLGEAKIAVAPIGPVMRLGGTLEMSGLNLAIDSRRVEGIVRSAGEYLVGGEAFVSEETWCGMRPCTPDGLPIIGRADPLVNLIVATGHAMLGVSLGPITGKLVAQLVCEQKPTVDPVPLGPQRFQ